MTAAVPAVTTPGEPDHEPADALPADAGRAGGAGPDPGADRPGRAPLWAAAGGWHGITVAVGLLAATRVAQLLVLAWMGRATGDGTGVWGRLLIWDASWFLRVATEGYPTAYSYDNGELVGNGLAFFPVYPMLIRGVVALGVAPNVAAVAVAWVASVAAAIAVHLLGTTLDNRRVGYALVVLCCAQPMSVVLSMAYSEAIFLALVAGMLVATHRQVWWVAGLLGLGATLTRPTGLAAALALTAAALLAIRDNRRARASGQPTDGTWQPLLAAGVVLAGVPAYLGWVAWRVGDLDAWFTIQTAGWGTSFDYGANTVAFVEQTLGGSDQWVPVSTALILLAALAGGGVALVGRPWLPLAVYGVATMVLVYGQAGYYHSKPRLLLPVLLVLLPAAAAAARARPRVAVAALLAWAAFGLWYGAYMVTVWPYTI